MDELNTYLNILIDTIKMKIDMFKNIYKITGEQEQMLNGDFDTELFQKTIDEKQKYIDEVKKLDFGFETTYKKIGNEVSNNKEKYKDQIVLLKQSISQVMELGVKIQLQEENNKTKSMGKFSVKKSEVKTYKKSKSTVAAYYKNINSNVSEQSFFIDQKN